MSARRADPEHDRRSAPEATPAGAHSPVDAPGHFPLVDSMRALAALSIVLFHMSFNNAWARPDGVVAQLVSRAEIGVTIFFLISGFLLYRPFALARLQGGRAPSTGAYAWRRFLRIFPAYWVALTVIGLALAANEVFVWPDGPLLYGLAQTYGERPLAFHGFGQTWSLCVELSFYVFLPIFALVMRALPARSPRGWLWSELGALAVLFAIGVAYKLAVLAPGSGMGGGSMMVLPAFLDQFAVGMALGVVSLHVQGRSGAGRGRGFVGVLDRFPGLLWLAAAGAFAVVSLGIGLQGGFEVLDRAQLLERHALFTLCATALLVPAIFGDRRRGVVRRLLGSRVLRWLGLISYGIFLWHLGWLFQLSAWGFSPADDGVLVRDVVWPIVAVGGAVALGAASWYLVERPALSLKRLVPGRRAAEGVARPPEAAPEEPVAARR